MRFIFRSSAHDYACVAQLVEQLTLNQWVRGSSPRSSTTQISYKIRDFFIYKQKIPARLDRNFLYIDCNNRYLAVSNLLFEVSLINIGVFSKRFTDDASMPLYLVFS